MCMCRSLTIVATKSVESGGSAPREYLAHLYSQYLDLSSALSLSLLPSLSLYLSLSLSLCVLEQPSAFSFKVSPRRLRCHDTDCKLQSEDSVECDFAQQQPVRFSVKCDWASETEMP